MSSPRSLDSVLRSAFHGLGWPVQDAETLEVVVGDVGHRRYFRHRPEEGPARVLAVYPDASEDACRRFLLTTDLLTRAGVRVPRVLEADCRAGWMWLEDLGSETLYQRYRGVEEPWEALAGWYEKALEALDAIQALPAERVAGVGNPPLDAELLRRELSLTEESYFEPKGLTGWRPVLDDLVAEIAVAAPVPCHRDFMVRNLVPLGKTSTLPLGVLDHQDLRMGPPFYDLASLLNDSLFPPPNLEDQWSTARLSHRADRLLYHRVAAQRTLKAVGTYARSGHHEELVEPTLRRAQAHLDRLPEAKGRMNLVD